MPRAFATTGAMKICSVFKKCVEAWLGNRCLPRLPGVKNRRKNLVNAIPGEPRDKDDRRKINVGKIRDNHSLYFMAFGVAVIFRKIPFVENNNNAFCFSFNKSAELQIL